MAGCTIEFPISEADLTHQSSHLTRLGQRAARSLCQSYTQRSDLVAQSVFEILPRDNERILAFLRRHPGLDLRNDWVARTLRVRPDPGGRCDQGSGGDGGNQLTAR